MTQKLETVLPKHCDAVTASFLNGLLAKDPKRRLSDPNQIKLHPYFTNIDWDKVIQKQIPAPFIPPIKDKKDNSMIDPMFTKEKVTLEDISMKSSDRIDQSPFKEFSFYGKE